MKILLVGNGAREHAIFKALKRSEHDPEIVVFAKAKNPGILPHANAYEVGDIENMSELEKIAEKHKPDFAVVGPDNPIGRGAADTLLSLGIKSVAPLEVVAQLEGSKSFTRNLLNKYDIPGNPKFKVFNKLNADKIEDYIVKDLKGQYVVKYDGLMGGKGVKVSGEHLESIDDGIKFAKECMKELDRVIIEEKLVGPEFSLMSFVDGKSQVAMPAVQDHKRAFNGDKGPNTGGMGSYSDSDHSLPFLTKQDIKEAETITRKTFEALEKETGVLYNGIMYGGFMKTKNGIRLIEYNARFGDPEAMNVLPLLETDFVKVCQAIIEGNLQHLNVEFKNQATVCLYVVPEGYPNAKLSDDEKIIRVDKKDIDAEIFFASVDLMDESKSEYFLKMSGSRALAFTGVADTIEQALEKAKEGLETVHGKVSFRTDIGTKELIQKKIDQVA